jgi:imidazolonepropionase-like amidohydrolase
MTVPRERRLSLDNINWFDIELRQVCKHQQIIIEDGKIVAINSSNQSPGTESVQVDRQGLYATPGFIDAHVHVAGSVGDSEKLFFIDDHYSTA